MRYQHVTFRKLAVGEEFFTKKFRYAKASFFTGRRVLDGALIFVSPWRKVRSTRPFGPVAPRIVGHIAKMMAVNAPFVNLINETRPGEHPRPLNVLTRPPQTVTPGGDRTPETIGGNEKCPSA